MRGAQQVLVPVTFGVLTTVAAFVPLLFATGVVGQALSIVAAVVVCCLIASLIECQCILPAHLGYRHSGLPLGEFGLVFLVVVMVAAFAVTPDARAGAALAVAAVAVVVASHFIGLLSRLASAFAGFQQRFEAWLDRLVRIRFRRLVQETLRKRRVTAAAAVAALATSYGIVSGGHLPFSLLLAYAGDRVAVQLTMPAGADEAATREVLRGIESAARRVKADLAAEHGEPVVLHILEAMGGHPSAEASLTAVSEPSGAHLGEVVMQLTPGEGRPVDTVAVAAMLREQIGAPPDEAQLVFVTERAAAGPRHRHSPVQPRHGRAARPGGHAARRIDPLSGRL